MDGTPVASEKSHTLADRFHALTHTINANRAESDIIFEVMLKMGLPLDSEISEVTVGSRKCYEVSGNIQGTNEDSKLLICLDKYITPDDVTAMRDAKSTLNKGEQHKNAPFFVFVIKTPPLAGMRRSVRLSDRCLVFYLRSEKVYGIVVSLATLINRLVAA